MSFNWGCGYRPVSGIPNDFKKGGRGSKPEQPEKVVGTAPVVGRLLYPCCYGFRARASCVRGVLGVSEVCTVNRYQRYCINCLDVPAARFCLLCDACRSLILGWRRRRSTSSDAGTALSSILEGITERLI
jgi:hypothetical protein